MTRALFLERMAERYHVPPHEVVAWDADFYLRHVEMLKIAESGQD